MKLFYYQTTTPSRNFGDELNPWLWPRLLPAFNEGSSSIFIGIGTMLNNNMPSSINKAQRIVFFSTGAGYGTELRVKHQPNWKIYCVRGPLSAQRLKLPLSLAITDGAALLNRFFEPVAVAERSQQFAYMPHFRHGSPRLLKAVCQQAGLRFIDPADTVENVIGQIAHSRGLISEAMHGAIVADTMRVPWLPIRTSPKILPFKWRDWCASLNLPYRYRVLKGVKPLSLREGLYPLRTYLQGQSSIANMVEGITLNDFPQILSIGQGADQKERWEKTLYRLRQQLTALTQATFYLSEDSILESRIARLEDSLQDLRRDIQMGHPLSAL